MGRLGRMVATFGVAFRMRVVACDVVPFQMDGVESVPFEQMLKESDAISIHVRCRFTFHLAMYVAAGI